LLIFRHHDVGNYKSKVAAQFVMRRCPDVKITPYTDRIQTFDMAFYKQFHVIIAGLDNIEARRWLNSMVHSMVEFEEDGSIVEGT
jgi:ubiquitin-activating enzyme E1 C